MFLTNKERRLATLEQGNKSILAAARGPKIEVLLSEIRKNCHDHPSLERSAVNLHRGDKSVFIKDAGSESLVDRLVEKGLIFGT